MLEWINGNENSDLVSLLNSFLVAFSTRQCSQLGHVILSIKPKRPSLFNLSIHSYPMWSNLACQTLTSIIVLLKEAIIEQ